MGADFVFHFRGLGSDLLEVADHRPQPLVGRERELGRDRHVLLFTAHHLVCDGWSLNVILADLSATLYEIVPGFLASSLAIWLVSKATPEPSPEIQAQFDEAAAAAKGA